MNALSKAIIAETLCEELQLAKPAAKEMVEDFFEELVNHKTGEEIPVVARRVVTFKPGLKLKTKIEAIGK